jgi:ParB-like chromosome segregation protein Spo0J
MPRPNSSPSDPSPTKQQLHLLNLDDLIPSTHNPRKHSRQQIRAIAKSIEAFGFCAPLLVDKKRQIIAGHGRYEAAKFLGLVPSPCNTPGPPD